MSRQFFLFVLVFSSGLAAGSYYFEYVLNLPPCSLCLIQRYLCLSLVVISGLGFLTPFKIFHYCLSLLSLIGLACAARQIYLQYLPAHQRPPCTPGLDYLLKNHPLLDTLKTVLKGGGECAEISWQFLGLSMPYWTAGAFGVILLSLLFNYGKNCVNFPNK